MADVVIVDENDQVIGTMDKAEAHRTGVPHRIAVVYVENPAGQIVVQVRLNGRLDHSAAGHVDPGESYVEAATRELQEELGISGVPLTYVGHGVALRENSDDGLVRSHVFDVFTCVAEPGDLQTEEVDSVYWADPLEVLTDMDAHPEKYAGAFFVSLKIFAEAKGLL